MSKILSGKVKKTASNAVSASRYSFISLQETEPDLGLPAADDYVLTGKIDGSRVWVQINTLIPGAADLGAQTNIFDGQISHKGLILTEGNNVDQVKTFNQTLTLSTTWQDTGINSTDLATGTYVLQLYANDGVNFNEYYSGVMSWWSGTTSSTGATPTDEIPLHRAGQGTNGKEIYLRTWRSVSGDTDNLKLQIYSNVANNSANSYIFKFRKMI